MAAHNPDMETLTSIATCPKCGAKNRINERAAETRQPICGRCGAKLSSSADSTHPIEITDATFEQVLAEAGNRPVLVDCWAAWCGPCRMLAPTIEALAREANGKWVIAKLDTDQNPQTASRFNISSIPTLLIFKNGKLVDQLVGLQPKPAITARLARHE
jgi:thioredoxin